MNVYALAEGLPIAKVRKEGCRKKHFLESRQGLREYCIPQGRQEENSAQMHEDRSGWVRGASWLDVVSTASGCSFVTMGPRSQYSHDANKRTHGSRGASRRS